MKSLKYILLLNIVLLSCLTHAETSQYRPFQNEASTIGHSSASSSSSSIPSSVNSDQMQYNEYCFTNQDINLSGDKYLNGFIIYAPPPGGGDGVKMPVTDSLWLFFSFTVIYLFILRSRNRKEEQQTNPSLCLQDTYKL